MKKKGEAAFLMRIMRGNWKYFLVCVIAMTFNVALSYLSPKVVGVTVDSVLGTGDFSLPEPILQFIQNLGGREYLLHHLYLCGLTVLVIALAAAVFQFVRAYSASKLAQHLSYKLRKMLFEHIQKLPFSWHKSIQTGDIMQRCSSDVDTVCNFVSAQFTDVVRIVVMLVLAYCLMFAINVRLSLASLAFVPVIILYSGLFYAKIAKNSLQADEAEGKMHAIAQENFTGVRVVRAFGREKVELERFRQGNGNYADHWIKTGKLLALYWSCGDLISALHTATLLVYGTVLTVRGFMSPGDIIVFLMYGGMLSWPLRRLGRTLGEMSKAGVSIKRIDEILSVEPEKPVCAEGCPELTGDLVFDHVSFGYEGDETLHDISFRIPAGQTLAILGGTGSGKSTLLHLLNRLYDLPETGGNIRIGGVDVRSIDRGYLRSHIAMVLQEPFLFSDTIRNNLTLGSGPVDDETLFAATKDAAIHESILAFPKGYDTLVGEKGVTLSGGQRQRVAIARALLQNAPILVFDDSLSAVDVQTDSRIRAALKSHTEHVTTIIVSHRVATLMDADQILVLSEGRVAELGTHEQLLALGGIYSSIYGIQSLLETELETEVADNGR